MQFLFAAVFIFAVYKAIRHGIPAGFRATRAAGRNRMDRWRAANPNASTPAILGHQLAALAAAGRYGPGYVRREMGAAFRAGWDERKQRYGLTPQPEDAAAADVDRNTSGGPAPQPTPGRAPHLRPVPQPAPTERNPEMAIKTATGGSITSPESLHAEIEAIEQEAVAELEDAKGDATRADEDLARIDRMVASLARLKYRSDDVAVIAALKEDAVARKSAAEARVAAANRRLAKCRAAKAVAAKHVSFRSAGAAGETYAAS